HYLLPIFFSSTTLPSPSSFFFFFLMIRRPPRSTPLSLHDALPISDVLVRHGRREDLALADRLFFHFDDRVVLNLHDAFRRGADEDRKSTRLNSSHVAISYAVFCLKKKKKTQYNEDKKSRI